MNRDLEPNAVKPIAEAHGSATPVIKSVSLPLTLFFAVLAALIRLIPFGVRPPNFAANGALSLFGGAKLPLYLILPIQFAVLACSDIILYMVYGWRPFNLAVYIGFALYAIMGRYLLRGKDSVLRIVGATWLGSLTFFLLTNFAAWVQLSPLGSGPVLYEASFRGLIECYTKGLVFLLYTMAGDFGCTAVMFGAEAWLRARVEQTTEATIGSEVRS